MENQEESFPKKKKKVEKDTMGKANWVKEGKSKKVE